MTNHPRLIPTPRSMEYGAGMVRFASGQPVAVFTDACGGERAAFAYEYLCSRLLTEFGLTVVAARDSASARLVLTDLPDTAAAYLSEHQLCALSAGKYARTQGYALKCSQGQPVLLYGCAQVGCLYAVATFLELLEKADDGAQLSECVVLDSPDFEYRGNAWLLYAETSGWSYDFGDGQQNYLRRAIQKLDMCVRFKVNMVMADGLDWSTQKFPGYAELLRELNREARRRGIHLVSTGYGSGYGASAPGNGNLFQGQVFFNRTAYPDGDIYPCQFCFGRDMITGSCLSNDALQALKEKELCDFVRAVEPGGLYIHHLDASDVTKFGWEKRCEACRKRWPNDDLFAEDGAAGAYAQFYSRIARALKSVKGDTGYDASKDLLIMFVSPGYGWYDESDESWRQTVRYWGKVGELLERENVFITLREQYYDNNIMPHSIHTRRRFDHLRDVFDQQCPAAQTGIIYFGGSDGFYSDRLFNTVPVYHYTQLGVDLMLNADGNAFQEPLQLLNAEYMWNSQRSLWHSVRECERPQNYFSCMTSIKRAGLGLERQEGIYGEDGFLHHACQKLYGERVGEIMERVYKLSGEDGEQPAAYLKNVDICAAIFQNPPTMAWHNELDDYQVKRMELAVMRIAALTREAARITEPLISMEGVDETARFMAECFRVNSGYLDALAGYMKLRGELLTYIAHPDAEAEAGIREEIVALHSTALRLRAEWEASGLKSFCYMGASLCGRDMFIDFFERNAVWMLECLTEKKRMPVGSPERHEWW